MARWKTHNRRADKKRRMPYARFRKLRKAARFGMMYGMGARKFAETFKGYGMTPREAATKMTEFSRSLRVGVRDYAQIEQSVLAHYRDSE